MGRHIASPLYYGGIHDPQAGHFHPLNYAIGLAQAAEAVGVRIRENDPVLAINTRGGGPTELVTERTVITARHVIDATDSWIDRKSVVSGKSVSVRVDSGGRRIIKKKKRKKTKNKKQ